MSQPEIKVTKIKITDLATLRDQRKASGAAPTGETSKLGGHSIVTIPAPKEQAITAFEPGDLKDRRGVKYSEAMKGVDMSTQKNARFRLNDLVRGPLSVEAEEEARVEAEVERRLALKIDEAREKARQEGYDEGFKLGKDDARKEVLAACKPDMERFAAFLSELEAMRGEIFKANEEYLIRMVYRLANHVLLRELKEDAEYVKRLVSQLLERLGTRENIKIFVGEAEYSSAEALKEGLAQSVGQLKNLSIELDASIAGRGCRVETEFGEVDAQIEVQIQNIAQALGVS